MAKIKNIRAVRALCKAGKRINAIKLLRDSNQPAMGLFHAKQWVDREYPELVPTAPTEIVTLEHIVRLFNGLTPEGKRWVRERLAAIPG
jgi:hypothetical protein